MIYGIAHAEDKSLRDTLLLCPPAECADALADGSADIALVPVAALPKIPDARIITSFCISANGQVATVALLSNTELNQIHTIFLDTHSRTSVNLVKVLAREHWAINPKYIDELPAKLEQGQAMVAIGDKVFDLEKQYSHKIDLSEQWQQMTKLPFVFAVWATRRKDLDQTIIDKLDRAIAYGVHNIPLSVPWDDNRERNLHYLTRNIEFELNDKKREAINLFLSKL